MRVYVYVWEGGWVGCIAFVLYPREREREREREGERKEEEVICEQM